MITLTTEQAQQIELDIIEAQQYFGTHKIGQKALTMIRVARGQQQAEPEPLVMLTLCAEVVKWNRSLAKPIIEIGMESEVAKAVAELYAAPVCTKDLTDDEIKAIALPMIPDEECSSEDQANFLAIEVIRAVIAADREKNR